jgi:plastocyanin
MRAPLVALALLAVWAPLPAAAGVVAGRVSLAVGDARLADLGPTVVYLDAGDAPAASTAIPGKVSVRQHNARFEPEFLVVVEGQTVEMPNDDTIFHNVFSFSRPNDFDLGLYPAGSSRQVVFRHPGVVRVYCSIHESMRGTILVTPTAWFSGVTASGEFRIPDVPPGRYRITVWNEKLPLLTQPVRVTDPGTQRLELSLGGATP